jgi:hypothetical protein
MSTFLVPFILIVFSVQLCARPMDFTVPEAWFRALATVESGGRDHAVGRSGEVSRYQITPANWRRHGGRGLDPTRPAHARAVAQHFWIREVMPYIRATGQRPTTAHAYALWHRPGAFRRVGYRLDALPSLIQRRCHRFAEKLKAES